MAETKEVRRLCREAGVLVGAGGTLEDFFTYGLEGDVIARSGMASIFKAEDRVSGATIPTMWAFGSTTATPFRF